jgi:hypothetical protein
VYGPVSGTAEAPCAEPSVVDSGEHIAGEVYELEGSRAAENRVWDACSSDGLGTRDQGHSFGDTEA